MEYTKKSIPEPYPVKTIQEFDDVRWRFYKVTGCETVFELADYLHTTAARISDARRRLLVPAEWFDLVASRTGADLTWLQKGD